MPEISRFYGIIIAMFWDDHNPPHFHARMEATRLRSKLTPYGFWTGNSHREHLAWSSSGLLSIVKNS